VDRRCCIMEPKAHSQIHWVKAGGFRLPRSDVHDPARDAVIRVSNNYLAVLLREPPAV